MTTALATDTLPPSRISDLTIRAVDDGSEYVIKNPRNRKYLKLGAVEVFLLERLDGQTTVDGILRSFESKFGEPLTAGELHEFVEMASSQGLLEGSLSQPVHVSQAGVWSAVLHKWR